MDFNSKKLRFKSYEELLDCISRNADIEFSYNDKLYSITPCDEGFSVLEQYKNETMKIYGDANDVGNYLIEGRPLKDIVKELKIIFRSF